MALAFDFRVADGVLGPQWSLVGSSRIERHGNWGQGAPEATAMIVDDTFVLDGQVLYLDGALYHTEQDDERYFAYVEGLDQWTATRDGWTWVFGGLDEGANGCAVEGNETYSWTCENRNGTPTFDETTAWMLASVTDPWGNTIEYTYTPNAALDADPGQLEGNYAYRHVLSQIAYGNGQHVIDFAYHGRADAPVAGDGSQLWLTTGRLEEITVTSGVSTIASRYALVYADEAVTACGVEAERSSWSADVSAVGTGESLLQRVVRMENSPTSAAGKSLRCMTQADEPDAWPEAEAIPLEFSTGTFLSSLSPGPSSLGATAFSSTRAFSNPAFYSHQVVNFDGDPEAELLELQFPVCDLEVSTYAQLGYVNDLGAREQAVTGYRLEGCDAVEVVANLWSVDPDLGRLTGGTSPVLVAALAAVEAANPATDPVAFVFLDIDRDGRTDAITATNGNPAVVHREEEGFVHSSADIYLNGTFEDAELLSAAVFTDIDGDGLVDLVWREGNDAFWLPNQGRSPYWNDASTATALSLPFTPSDDQPLQAGVVWADVNGDGMVDLTLASDGTPDPDDATAILSGTDWSEQAGVYYGVGDGSFRFATDPGYASLSEGYWVPWAGELTGTTVDPAQLWAGTLPWTYADVDHDGELEAVSAESLGLPYDELSYAGACSNFLPEGEYCNDGFVDGYQQLLADWTGDGFVDVLYIETPAFKVASGMADDYTVTTGGSGIATLYPGSRTVAQERVTAIETAWGGDIELTYGLSSDEGLNAELPWAVDVIGSVVDEAGTTEFTFDGGVWWPELGRFMGFRDALVTRENGGMTHVRYAPVPWAGGREVYRSDRRSDGSMEFFSYNSARNPATGQTTLDLAAPFFNPVRARCEAWVGPANNTGAQSVEAQSKGA